MLKSGHFTHPCFSVFLEVKRRFLEAAVFKKKEKRKKDTLGMGSGGDVFYMPLPIHELLVPFSRLGGLARNQNSSLSNSAFAFNDHTEKKEY